LKDDVMPTDTPPPPPAIQQAIPGAKRGNAPIADVREQFERKSPTAPDDEALARAFIGGKIEMIRRDPRMTEAEKAAAIADLEARR
jgi:hypothetical protein